MHMRMIQQQQCLQRENVYQNLRNSKRLDDEELPESGPRIDLVADEQLRQQILENAELQKLEMDLNNRNNIHKWVDRKYGEVDSYVSQVLWYLGCFNAYLNAAKKTDAEGCSFMHKLQTTWNMQYTGVLKMKQRQNRNRREIGKPLTPEKTIKNVDRDHNAELEKGGGGA